MSVALMVAGYLCGSIPFGLLIGRLKGVDIRQAGSGNIGATNVGRVLGRGWGILAFGCDLLKGFVPVLVFGLVVSGRIEGVHGWRVHVLQMGVAAGCILGHLFPLYLGFRGGKGVATSLGVVLAIYPYFTWTGLIAFAVWLALTGMTRYVSVGSIGAAIAFPIIFAGFARVHRASWGTAVDLWPMYVFALLIVALVVYRHRGNMQRLWRGTENKIGRRAKRADVAPPANAATS